MTAPDPGSDSPPSATPPPPPRRRPRRTVLMTAGLSASAAVMAFNLAAASPASAQAEPGVGSLYGDAAIHDPDVASESEDGES